MALEIISGDGKQRLSLLLFIPDKHWKLLSQGSLGMISSADIDLFG